MLKIGMRHEGTLRPHTTKWGMIDDLVVYGVLRGEVTDTAQPGGSGGGIKVIVGSDEATHVTQAAVETLRSRRHAVSLAGPLAEEPATWEQVVRLGLGRRRRGGGQGHAVLLNQHRRLPGGQESARRPRRLVRRCGDRSRRPAVDPG
jgi:hypothetical protein